MKSSSSLLSLLSLLLLTPLSCLGDFTCEEEGIFADPDACANFIQCALGDPGTNGEDATYIQYVTTCPETTLFEECDKVCEAEDTVDCGSRPRPDGSVDDPDAGPADCDGTAGTTIDTTPMTTSITTSSTEDTSSTTTEDVTTTTEGDGSTMSTTVATSTTSADTTTTETTSSTTTTTTVTTTMSATTTEEPTQGTPSEHPRFPDKVMGIYLTLADDTEEGFETDAEWEPALYEYQQEAANVLFFCFINPATMEVPKAFLKLSSSRGSGEPGSVPSDTVILFAVGGYQYSIDPNPWDWLTSRDKAEAMAEEVAEWRYTYNVDGIDLDIESGAGDAAGAGENLVYFIQRLREISPDFIVGQPTFGYPQVQAEIDVINASWNPGGTSNDLADSVGIMVYEGTQSLDYVENYAHGTQQYEGFPIVVDVPYNSIMVGSKGISASADISTLADEVVRQDLLGIMVWYASVVDGLQYDTSWDTSMDADSQQAYVQARQTITA